MTDIRNMRRVRRLPRENDLAIITWVICKYFNRHPEPSELITPGYYGYLSAKKNFDETKGYTFLTFATKNIRGKILNYLKKEREYKAFRKLETDLCTKEDKSGKEFVTDVFEGNFFIDKKLDEKDIINRLDFTPKQAEVTKLTMKGYTLREIGGIIGTSHETIRKELKRITSIVQNALNNPEILCELKKNRKYTRKQNSVCI